MLDIRFLENLVASAHTNDKICWSFKLQDGDIVFFKHSRALILKEKGDRLWCEYVNINEKFECLYSWVYATNTREAQYMKDLFKCAAKFHPESHDVSDETIRSLKDEEKIYKCYYNYIWPY